VDVSPKMHNLINNYKVKDFVHVSPLPDFYRGKYRKNSDLLEQDKEEEEERIANLYADDFEKLVKN